MNYKHEQIIKDPLNKLIHWSEWLSRKGIAPLKWLVTQKSNFFVGFPLSVQDFFVIKNVPLHDRAFGYLDLKFHNLSLFCIFSIDFADF